MRPKLAGTVGVWLLAGVNLVAADFWEEKDFTMWSDKEVQQMLTDSPWAKQVGILVSGRGRFDAIQPIQPIQPVQRINVTITWKSALPIKQAAVRQAIGLDAPIPAENHQTLERAEPFYTVTLSGLPPTFRWLATRRDALKAESMLARKDKAPIAPESVRLFQDAESRLISVVFRFSKTDAITLDDRDVDVITKLGNAEVATTFTLADMVFSDKLAL